MLSAVEAKKYPEFSKGEFQLVAYLAILRENRKRANKINSMTQGFYSDGLRFAFVHIAEDGIVKSSGIFDVRAPKGLKYIFSFIVSMMETAMKSTPTTTPIKPGLQRDREVSEFEDEVWTKVYALIDESVCVPSHYNPDDAIDLSWLFYSLFSCIHLTLHYFGHIGIFRGSVWAYWCFVCHCFGLLLSDTYLRRSVRFLRLDLPCSRP